ncbi:MAG TPA: phosphonate C-P lyase system protein PhnK [Gammaproteobacteria bacterium]|nr:MAG: ATP-binding cassette domain-containing protein [Gammaproteobacteria bacterium TMED163]HAR90633.1 phosphonate C-P lyase system protein PhnK [Gammaproteobacteria bacterium]HCI88769.1 phosphonate C-P lyase system protein PhnK [Gammaproteobacteria bacterium]|tara:strand:- start:268 stop:1089 length:822 start_codon:yes stop_codon:yes gene_type:complete
MTVFLNPNAWQPAPPRLIETAPILEVKGIQKRYGDIQAVANVDMSVYPGEIMGIVGESGSGKSTLLRMLHLEEPADAGSYKLNIDGWQDRELLQLDRFEQRKLRVSHIGIVYQHPHLGLRMHNTSSGNVAERLLVAGERTYSTLRQAAVSSLAASEFPLQRMDDLPRHLSGGMQQRVQLAKAIAMEPALLLLDEPTSGLDVSVQARVLDTLKSLQQQQKISTVLVSHDLGVIRTLADRVMVMRGGHVIEAGLTDQILEDPQEAYTQQLVHAKL